MDTIFLAILRDGEEPTSEVPAMKLFEYRYGMNDIFFIYNNHSWEEETSTAFDFIEIPAALDTSSFFLLDKIGEVFNERFDCYQIHPVMDISTNSDSTDFIICEPDQAELWTVYGHNPGEGFQALADCKDEETADLFATFLILKNPNLTLCI